MVKNIEISKYYKVVLKSKWPKEMTKNLYIYSKTDVNNIDKYDFDIMGTYFSPYGFGISTYYSYINESIPIYVCKEISDLNEVKTSKEDILISASMIDMDKSGEFYLCRVANVNINPLIIYKDGPIAYEEYLNNLKDEVRTKLETSKYFIGLPMRYDVSYTNRLVQKESYDTSEAVRNEHFEEFENVYLQKSKMREYERNIALEQHRISVEKETMYNSMIASANLKLQEANDTLNEYTILNQNLLAIKDRIEDLYNKIKDGTISISDFPTFEQLWDEL